LLIAHGADVNARDSQDVTPLGVVIKHRHPEVVQVLKGAGGTDSTGE
ncbi:MAG: ankyrin repeat domain-containing protein, partial [Planctomycetes bacterium]|nr:ankyrin repeat domain-containing protein [Planctomycetota bacterium]